MRSRNWVDGPSCHPYGEGRLSCDPYDQGRYLGERREKMCYGGWFGEKCSIYLETVVSWWSVREMLVLCYSVGVRKKERWGERKMFAYV
ncbi:hypothetical protein AMTRI_Chr12g274560 [Amborella trichopoda]